MGRPRKGLTDKQDEYAKALILSGGNQSEAARLAGYSKARAQQTGSELMLNPNVQEAIKRYRASAESKAPITIEGVLSRIAEIGAVALSTGNMSVAARCQELLGRALGGFVDRSQSVSINVDASEAHLDALISRARQRANVIDVTPNP